MGMFKDVRKMKKQGKEMQKAQGRRGGLRGMKDAVGEASAAMDSAMEMQASMALLQTGTPADATVTGMSETGQFINYQPVVVLNLDVTVGSGPPVAVENQATVPPTMTSLIQPGSVLKVKVDQSDFSKLAIDWAGTQMSQANPG